MVMESLYGDRAHMTMGRSPHFRENVAAGIASTREDNDCRVAAVPKMATRPADAGRVAAANG